MMGQKEKAGSPGPSLLQNLCGLSPSLSRQGQERPAKVGVVDCGAFVALRRSQKLFACDPASFAKSYPDYVAHLSVSKCAPRLEASH